MKLTIAIPNYNNSKGLKKAVLSCKSISLNNKDYEILIIDDKSTDNSLEVSKKLAKKLDNVRVEENKKNLGRIPNWNKAIELAKGDYLIFLFSNDKLYPKNNIGKMIKLLDENKDVSFVQSRYAKESGKRLFQMQKNRPIGYVNSKDFIKKAVEHNNLVFAPLQTIIFRRKYINIKFYKDFPISTDQIFAMILGLKRSKIFFNKVNQVIWKEEGKRFHYKIKHKDNFKERLFYFNIINKYLDASKLKFSFFSFILLLKMFKWNGFNLSLLFNMLRNYIVFIFK